MKFFKKLFNKRSNYDEEIGVDISDSNFWEKFGVKLKFLISGKRVLKENTVYICTKVRAESIGKLSLKIYKIEKSIKSMNFIIF